MSIGRKKKQTYIEWTSLIERKIDGYIGLKWYSLTVIGKGEKPRTAKCVCDCGKSIDIPYSKLKKGEYKSCGCNISPGKEYDAQVKRMSRILYGMRSRCENKSSSVYNHYGGRGILICKEWKESKLFFINWALKNGYNDNLSIDRINTNGNYEPSNCRWADWKTQINNRTNTTTVFYEPLYTFCESRGVDPEHLRRLLKKGLSEEEATEIVMDGKDVPPLEPWTSLPDTLTREDVVKMYIEV